MGVFETIPFGHLFYHLLHKHFILCSLTFDDACANWLIQVLIDYNVCITYDLLRGSVIAFSVFDFHPFYSFIFLNMFLYDWLWVQLYVYMHVYNILWFVNSYFYMHWSYVPSGQSECQSKWASLFSSRTCTGRWPIDRRTWPLDGVPCLAGKMIYKQCIMSYWVILFCF